MGCWLEFGLLKIPRLLILAECQQESFAGGGVYSGYLPYIEGLISISSVVQSGIAFLIWEFVGPEHIWDILINCSI